MVDYIKIVFKYLKGRRFRDKLYLFCGALRDRTKIRVDITGIEIFLIVKITF